MAKMIGESCVLNVFKGTRDELKEFLVKILHREDCYIYETKRQTIWIWSDNIISNEMQMAFDLGLPHFVILNGRVEEPSLSIPKEVLEELPDINLDDLEGNT